MIFDTLQYVDAGGATQEIALALQNLSANGGAVSLYFTPKSHAPSEFTITWAQAPETGIAVPFKSRCIVFASRVSVSGAPNSFTGGTILFQGRRWDNDGSASAENIACTLTLLDAWKDLEKVTYTMPWLFPNGGTSAAPTFGTFNWPDIVLFQANPGTTYSPAAVNSTITTWQQIQDLIRFAATYAAVADAVQLQLGQTGTLAGNVWTGGLAPEFTPSFVNWNPVRSAKVADCLNICLQPHPAVFTEIDYTTVPPTLHFRNRASLTAITLPYKSTDANGIIHEASEVKSLDELVPDNVRLFYKINGTFNGNPAVNFSEDAYPDNANHLLNQDFSIDVTGAAVSETIYNFTSFAFGPTSLALWRKKMNSLKQVSEGGRIPNDGNPGALSLLGVSVLDETGAVINLGTYQYYTDQAVYAWIPGSLVISANVIADFSYQETTGGALNLTTKIVTHRHSMRLKLTNLPSGLYFYKQTLNSGESIPPNLAQNVYTELKDLQWKLDHKVTQVAPDATTVPLLVKPGKHKINLAGGNAAWTTMNAVPETVNIEFLRTADGKLVARHKIKCGPVHHLNPGYLLALYNFFWNRNKNGIDASQRLSGSVSSSQVDLSASSTRENSVPANADYSQHIVYSPDTLDATRSQVITHDATTGQITVAQLKSADGTSLVSGVINPQYSFAGPPGPATLP